jgi:hypothetical protein
MRVRGMHTVILARVVSYTVRSVPAIGSPANEYDCLNVCVYMRQSHLFSMNACNTASTRG